MADGNYPSATIIHCPATQSLAGCLPAEPASFLVASLNLVLITYLQTIIITRFLKGKRIKMSVSK